MQVHTEPVTSSRGPTLSLVPQQPAAIMHDIGIYPTTETLLLYRLVQSVGQCLKQSTYLNVRTMTLVAYIAHAAPFVRCKLWEIILVHWNKT